MSKMMLWTALAALLLMGGAFAFRSAHAGRIDCPGTIVCPITGDDVCVDRCPLGAKKPEKKAGCCQPAE